MPLRWYDAVVSNTKPIRVNNGIPAVDSSASPWLRDRLGFVRRTDFRNEYRKQHAVPSGSLRMDAEVSQGRQGRKTCALLSVSGQTFVAS